jgi:hypothetical protein
MMTAGIARPQSSTIEPQAPGAHRLPAGHPSSQLNVAKMSATPRNANAVPTLATKVRTAAKARQPEESEPGREIRALRCSPGVIDGSC